MLTFGTGIGSAVFIDGMLVPNTEFGHIQMHGVDAEKRAAARVRQDEDLGWAPGRSGSRSTSSTSSNCSAPTCSSSAAA